MNSNYISKILKSTSNTNKRESVLINSSTTNNINEKLRKTNKNNENQIILQKETTREGKEYNEFLSKDNSNKLTSLKFLGKVSNVSSSSGAISVKYNYSNKNTENMINQSPSIIKNLSKNNITNNSKKEQVIEINSQTSSTTVYRSNSSTPFVRKSIY